MMFVLNYFHPKYENFSFTRTPAMATNVFLKLLLKRKFLQKAWQSSKLLHEIMNTIICSGIQQKKIVLRFFLGFPIFSQHRKEQLSGNNKFLRAFRGKFFMVSSIVWKRLMTMELDLGHILISELENVVLYFFLFIFGIKKFWKCYWKTRNPTLKWIWYG